MLQTELHADADCPRLDTSSAITAMPKLGEVVDFDGGRTQARTLLHAVYEGVGRAAALPNDAFFEVNVQAFSRAPTKLTKMPVPYALAVTLELADSIETDIFTPIVQRLRPPVRA